MNVGYSALPTTSKESRSSSGRFLPGYEYPLVGELPEEDDSLWPRGRVTSILAEMLHGQIIIIIICSQFLAKSFPNFSKIGTSDSERGRIFQHFSRSTRFSHYFQKILKIVLKFLRFSQKSPEFSRTSSKMILKSLKFEYFSIARSILIMAFLRATSFYRSLSSMQSAEYRNHEHALQPPADVDI